MEAWDNTKRQVRFGYAPEDVQEAIKDQRWQKFRRSMKGKPTRTKLDMLADWWDRHIVTLEMVNKNTNVQVGNYLGALRRGGQLDMNNRVQKDY